MSDTIPDPPEPPGPTAPPSSGPVSSRADARLLVMLESAFAHHAGADANIDAAELQRALGIKDPALAARVFACFDRDGNGVISRDEFIAGVRTLVLGSEREKLHFAFRVHDIKGDGYLDRDEIYRMIAMSLAESEIRDRPTQSPEALTRAVFAGADNDRDGRISFAAFETAVRKRPALLANMVRNEATWLAPDEDLLSWIDERTLRRAKRAKHPRRGFTDRAFAPIVFLVLWGAAQVAVFLHALLTGDGSPNPNEFHLVGRALGRVLDLDGALILVPMMRRLLTRVRASFLGRVIPVDDAIDFHRYVGHAMIVLAVAHVAAFVVTWAQGHAGASVLGVLSTSRGTSGALLFGVFAVMWFFALAFVRRSKRFELFYFTHLLYLAWFVLAVVHAPVFALWAGVPLFGFFIERILSLSQRPPNTVQSLVALRSGVARLEIARPPNFKFKPGDYVFLKVPAITRHEWHPFTISSAPERPNLAFHVRALGNWTSALRRLAESGPPEATRPRPLVVYLDGPYGSPTGQLFKSRFAVLIGAGIGVTPFASVLDSIVARADPTVAKGDAPRPDKTYFYWVNRDQYSFEWFTALLYWLEQIDREKRLDLHLWMTGGKAGATALGLELARDVMRDYGRADLVTGLRTQTHFGPPDWHRELGAIRDRHAPERVDVYFCGPPGLGRKIRAVCRSLGMAYREERF